MKPIEFLVLFVLTLGPSLLRADYVPPTFEEAANWSTAIVDATVVEFVTRDVKLETGSYKRQEVRLEIHRHLVGEMTPTTLTGFVSSCKGELHRVLKLKSRYILCLEGDRLLEASTAYEVREVEGKTECYFRDARSPKEAAWLTIQQFEERLRAAQGPVSTQIGAVTWRSSDPGKRLPIPLELRAWISREIVNVPPVGGGDRGALVRQAYEKLGKSRSKEDWDEGFKDLVKLEAWGCVLSCVWHEDDELRWRALSQFEGQWDKHLRIQIVRSLLPLANSLAVLTSGGSESQMFQWRFQKAVAAVLSAQTSVKVSFGDSDGKWLAEGVDRWRKWLEEQKDP